jgi:nitrite reductase/ring-hydroxylating ferredoxin subunit/DMSO/TMAO reductase YedYZ heme-binding membrane subunit
MGVEYRAISWSPEKKRYDKTLAVSVGAYLALFVGLGVAVNPDATAETHLIRGLGTGAFLLLHLVLAIGPLCRLDSRFLPLLYNRRHMGVTMFVLALAHGVFGTIQFHALGDVNPLVSLLASNTQFGSVAEFPFEVLGLGALVILFVMAATSHDFWLHNLSAPVWKRLHMLVYVAYVLLVGHVALGALQSERSPLLAGLLLAGAVAVVGLHLAAGRREREADQPSSADKQDGFVETCGVADIAESRAKIVCLAGERVAVFRHQGRVSAISNVCQHQNGPLGEGKIIDGCVTCPWHGYQYEPATGASPPPFEEKVPTFRTRIVGDRVFVDPQPLPPGTRVEPSVILEAVEDKELSHV